jgi:hypothetical protein
MRKYYSILMLLALIVSCKEEDVSLANQLAGAYYYYENGNIPDVDKNGSQPLGDGGITIEALGKDLIKIRINNQGRRIWDFPECQIIESNNGGKRIYPFFMLLLLIEKPTLRLPKYETISLPLQSL